jgi:hypothetical protein
MAKLQLALGCLILLMPLAGSVEATPIQTGDAFDVAFHATTCQNCWGPNENLPIVDVQGILTVAPTLGTFWDPWYQTHFLQDVLMVTAVTGTLTIDCSGVAVCAGEGAYSLSFLAANPSGDGWSAPRGDGSYLWPFSAGGIPRYVVFSADGAPFDTRFIHDNAYNLFQWNGQVPVHFSAQRVPDRSSSLVLLTIAIAALSAVKIRST